MSGKVNVTWTDSSGRPFSGNGDCVDISPSGLKIKMEAQIAARTVVTVKAKALALHGSASVRTCTRSGLGYVIGLEFLGGMSWQIPESFGVTRSQ